MAVGIFIVCRWYVPILKKFGKIWKNLEDDCYNHCAKSNHKVQTIVTMVRTSDCETGPRGFSRVDIAFGLLALSSSVRINFAIPILLNSPALPVGVKTSAFAISRKSAKHGKQGWSSKNAAPLAMLCLMGSSTEVPRKSGPCGCCEDDFLISNSGAWRG